MKKQIPAIVLAVLCVALVIALQLERRKKTAEATEPSPAESVAPEQRSPAGAGTNAELQAVLISAAPDQDLPPLDEIQSGESEDRSASTRRIMQSMARTIEDNPTINKMVEASQRGAIGALYADMIEYLDLDAEETRYFMDLLMYRQMAHVDAHMKMASGELTDEEKLALQEKVDRITEATRSEIEEFINNPEDFEEFKYYEETIGERMMLSQMDQMLGDNTLSDETYREVLEVMYNVREGYDWSTDLNDNENRDLSAERFSQENIRKHMTDVRIVGELMDQRMQEILTPEQLAAWRESGAAMSALMEGQLLQANQMFGGE